VCEMETGKGSSAEVRVGGSNSPVRFGSSTADRMLGPFRLTAPSNERRLCN
jgi:hypothetical protein